MQIIAFKIGQLYITDTTAAIYTYNIGKEY